MAGVAGAGSYGCMKYETNQHPRRGVSSFLQYRQIMEMPCFFRDAKRKIWREFTRQCALPSLAIPGLYSPAVFD